MIKRKSFAILIVSLLALFCCTGALAVTGSSQLWTAELAASRFIHHKLQSVSADVLANELVLKTSLQCADRLQCLKADPTDKSCRKVQLHEVKTSYLSGRVESVEMDCLGLFEHYFGIVVNEDHDPEFNAPVAKRFRKFRLTRALSEPSWRDDNRLFYILKDKYTGLKFNTDIGSIVPEWSTGWSLSYTDPNPLTKSESDRLEKYYSDMLGQWLSEFEKELSAGTVKVQIPLVFEEVDGITRAILTELEGTSCSPLLSDYLLTDNWHDTPLPQGCGFHLINYPLRKLQETFARWVYDQRLISFREEMMNQHYELGISSPLFHQVADKKLSWEALAIGLERMLAMHHGSSLHRAINAEETLAWRDLSAIYNYDLNENYEQMLAFANRHHLPEAIRDGALELMQEHFKGKQRMSTIIHTSSVFGSLVFCVAGGRILKALNLAKKISQTTKILGTSSCYFVLGLPLNTFFLGEGIQSKKQEWKRALGAAEFSLMQKNIEALKESDLNIFLSIAFMPAIVKFDHRIIRATTSKDLWYRLLRQLK